MRKIRNSRAPSRTSRADPPSGKYFASVFQNSVFSFGHPGPHEGRFAIVTNVGL
jgi:hypothetical protein